MSTHILSDIEALCDEVAILRKGRLAASGDLKELLESSGESRVLEISVQGVEADAIREKVEFIAGATLIPEPHGAVIQVLDESDIDAVLKITREAGGRLCLGPAVETVSRRTFCKRNCLTPIRPLVHVKAQGPF